SQMVRAVTLGIKQVQFRTRVIDQVLPIARKMACIEIPMIRMATKVFTCRYTGIDIPNSLVVRDEVDTLTDPAGISDIAIEMKQTLECTAVSHITPQMSYPAAPVPFLMCHFTHVYIATNDN